MKIKMMAVMTSLIFGLLGCNPISDQVSPDQTPVLIEPTAKPDYTPQPSLTPTLNEDAPKPDDSRLMHGPAFLDSAEFVLVGAQYQLHLVGSTPTPCHMLRVSVAPPDEKNRIIVDTYSVSDRKGVCADVLAPFDVQVPLGTDLVGNFSVWVNGQDIGQIQVPVVD